MKDLEFKEYVHYYDDDDGDEHSTTVVAAFVDKGHVTKLNDDGNRVANRRTIVTLDGDRRIADGDVVVEGYRPGVYDVLSHDQWAANGYELPEDAEAATQDSKPVPAKKTAVPPAK